MKYDIEKIASLIHAQVLGSGKQKICYLLTDSRSLSFPEETLFFALRTQRNDGHAFITQLYERGVRTFVVERLPKNAAQQFPTATFLLVENSLQALQLLAQKHREQFSIPIIAITGSNGKTIVKEWLYQVLSEDLRVTRSPKSYNSQIGVPLSVWLLDNQTQIGVFEAGISMRGEMDALEKIIEPTIAVLTNIGSAHQENFDSLREKCDEKLKLAQHAQKLVYCADNDVVRDAVAASSFKGEKLCWSSSDRAATLFVSDVKKSNDSTVVTYVYDGVESTFSIPFIDEASFACACTCALVARTVGVSADDLARRMPNLDPIAMRLEVKEGQRGCTLINDSYNSDLNALDIALDFMNRREERLPHTLILSDIKDVSASNDLLYQKVNEMIQHRGLQKLIGIGDEIGKHAKSFAVPHKFFFQNVAEFLSSDVFRNLHDETILIKGARQFGFERITDLLVKKVHETTLEVNLTALVDNLNRYRSFMKPDTRLVCMIKADAYGAGAVEVARTLQEHRVDYLAVAVADEGVTLRKNGITSNIMIMNPEMSAFNAIFDEQLEPEIYSFRLLDAFIKAANKEGISDWPVHIKFDSGMHRLGFEQKDVAKLIDILQHQNAVVPRSVFSHFVGSDSDDFDDFSAQQFAKFQQFADTLQSAFQHHILRHIDNSAGIEHFPERQLDMCRLGLGLYGINPRNNETLNNVSSLKTTILQLRNVPAGDTVGYSRRGKITRPSVIAAIPIGYADGLDRHLGNGNGYCIVNGQHAPYVGNICMDVAMIDVTDIPCSEGDSVEIFGDQLSPSVLADILNTIPYEIMTSVSNRVKRIYFRD